MSERLTGKSMSLVVEQYGVVAYRQAYERQLTLVDQLYKDERSDDICMVLEHQPVFTLGRNGSPCAYNRFRAVSCKS